MQIRIYTRTEICYVCERKKSGTKIVWVIQSIDDNIQVDFREMDLSQRMPMWYLCVYCRIDFGTKHNTNW